MKTFIRKNPYLLWAELTRSCLIEGTLIFDEAIEIIEISNVSFQIKTPLGNDPKLEKHCDHEMIDAMIKNFNSFEPQFGYRFSYGERIFGKNGSSAYENIIDLLRRKPEAKSATISLIRDDDLLNSHVPCIATIDFKIRNGKINLNYFARSQDIFKKSYADNIALAELQRRLSSDLEVKSGSISGYIASAHIYKSDLPKIESIDVFQSIKSKFKFD